MRSKPPIIATIRAEAGRRVGGGDALVEEAVSGADYSCTGVVSGAAVVSEAGPVVQVCGWLSPHQVVNDLVGARWRSPGGESRWRSPGRESRWRIQVENPGRESRWRIQVENPGGEDPENANFPQQE